MEKNSKKRGECSNARQFSAIGAGSKQWKGWAYKWESYASNRISIEARGGRKQRAKKHRLKQWDKNTKFFHLHANQRRKMNRISHIMGLDSQILTDQHHMGNLFSSFYSQWFTSSKIHLIEECLQALFPCISIEMNQHLNEIFCEQEYTTALFQMNLLGALGPDGFLAHFYKRHWPTIKKDVYSFTLNVLNHHSPLEDVNSTFYNTHY